MVNFLWFGIGIAICYYGFLFLLEWQYRKQKKNTHTPNVDLPIVSSDDMDEVDHVEDFRYNPIFRATDEEGIDNETSLRIIKGQKTI